MAELKKADVYADYLPTHEDDVWAANEVVKQLQLQVDALDRKRKEFADFNNKKSARDDDDSIIGFLNNSIVGAPDDKKEAMIFLREKIRLEAYQDDIKGPNGYPSSTDVMIQFQRQPVESLAQNIQSNLPKD